jgi:hypothetical protein
MVKTKSAELAFVEDVVFDELVVLLPVDRRTPERPSANVGRRSPEREHRAD